MRIEAFGEYFSEKIAEIEEESDTHPLTEIFQSQIGGVTPSSGVNLYEQMQKFSVLFPEQCPPKILSIIKDKSPFTRAEALEHLREMVHAIDESMALDHEAVSQILSKESQSMEDIEALKKIFHKHGGAFFDRDSSEVICQFITNCSLDDTWRIDLVDSLPPEGLLYMLESPPCCMGALAAQGKTEILAHIVSALGRERALPIDLMHFLQRAMGNHNFVKFSLQVQDPHIRHDLLSYTPTAKSIGGVLHKLAYRGSIQEVIQLIESFEDPSLRLSLLQQQSKEGMNVLDIATLKTQRGRVAISLLNTLPEKELKERLFLSSLAGGAEIAHCLVDNEEWRSVNSIWSQCADTGALLSMLDSCDEGGEKLISKVIMRGEPWVFKSLSSMLQSDSRFLTLLFQEGEGPAPIQHIIKQITRALIKKVPEENLEELLTLEQKALASIEFMGRPGAEILDKIAEVGRLRLGCSINLLFGGKIQSELYLYKPRIFSYELQSGIKDLRLRIEEKRQKENEAEVIELLSKKEVLEEEFDVIYDKLSVVKSSGRIAKLKRQVSEFLATSDCSIEHIKRLKLLLGEDFLCSKGQHNNYLLQSVMSSKCWDRLPVLIDSWGISCLNLGTEDGSLVGMMGVQNWISLLRTSASPELCYQLASQKSSEFGSTALQALVVRNEHEVVAETLSLVGERAEELILLRANNGANILHDCSAEQSLECQRAVLGHVKSESCLYQLLITPGEGGWTPMHYYAARGNAEAIQELLNLFSDPSRRLSLLQSRHSRGETVFSSACKRCPISFLDSLNLLDNEESKLALLLSGEQLSPAAEIIVMRIADAEIQKDIKDFGDFESYVESVRFRSLTESEGEGSRQESVFPDSLLELPLIDLMRIKEEEARVSLEQRLVQHFTMLSEVQRILDDPSMHAGEKVSTCLTLFKIEEVAETLNHNQKIAVLSDELMRLTKDPLIESQLPLVAQTDKVLARLCHMLDQGGSRMKGYATMTHLHLHGERLARRMEKSPGLYAQRALYLTVTGTDKQLSPISKQGSPPAYDAVRRMVPRLFDSKKFEVPAEVFKGGHSLPVFQENIAALHAMTKEEALTPSQRAIVQAVASELESSLAFVLNANESKERVAAYITSLHEKLKGLEVGAQLFLPGGYIKKKKGHAIGLVFSKQENGLFTLRVINRGEGARLYSGLTKENRAMELEAMNLPLEEIIHLPEDPKEANFYNSGLLPKVLGFRVEERDLGGSGALAHTGPETYYQAIKELLSKGEKVPEEHRYTHSLQGKGSCVDKTQAGFIRTRFLEMCQGTGINGYALYMRWKLFTHKWSVEAAIDQRTKGDIVASGPSRLIAQVSNPSPKAISLPLFNKMIHDASLVRTKRQMRLRQSGQRSAADLLMRRGLFFQGVGS